MAQLEVEGAYANHWESTARMEHEFSDGVTLEDRIQKEVDLVVEQGNLNLNNGSKVLDLASGTALHAIRLHKLTGAQIEARELDNVLVGQAIDKISNELGPKAINISQGSYGEIKDALKEGDQFDAVTCFGTSFMYLKSHQEYLKALGDLKDVLKPGGKLVLQWREKHEIENRPMMTPDKIRARGFKTIPGSSIQDPLGRKIYGDAISRISGENTGEGFYVTEGNQTPPPVHPYADIEGPAGDIPYDSFGKGYIAPDGTITPIANVDMLNYMDTRRFPVLKRLLEDAGFQNVKLIPDDGHGVDLSLDGRRRLFAVVAEKPVQ